MIRLRIFLADIGGTTIKMAIANGDGSFIKQWEVPTSSHLGGPSIMNTVIEHILAVKHIDAVGISTAGQVDSENGIVIYANENIPNYTGMQIRKLIQDKINVPVAVDNDVNCAAIGEGYYGSGKEVSNFLCLTYGTGIGGAIIMNGELVKGHNGLAGEFGHIITHGNGRLCGCGGKGCYEQYGSTTALINAVKKLNPSITNGRKLFAQIDAGNHALMPAVNDWIKEVCYGLVSLTHIFNPPLIIVGGGVMEREEITYSIQKKTTEMMMNSFHAVEIKQALLGNRAGLYGALVIANQEYEQQRRI